MRINQAQTAIDHYRSGAVNKHGQIAKILLEMSSSRDYTIGELAHLLGMEKSTISARRAEMLEFGFVVRGNRRKCRFSGITCETVKLKGE